MLSVCVGLTIGAAGRVVICIEQKKSLGCPANHMPGLSGQAQADQAESLGHEVFANDLKSRIASTKVSRFQVKYQDQTTKVSHSQVLVTLEQCGCMLTCSCAAVGGAGGLVLLFHGTSGVGKTMMANAVAKHVQRKVLLINFPSLGSNQAGEVIRFIFRSVLHFSMCALVKTHTL